jgi:tetratricopeptide (TPR) repeat protein
MRWAWKQNPNFVGLGIRFLLLVTLLLSWRVTPHSDWIKHWLSDGDQAVQQGRYADAQRAYDRLFVYDPDNPLIYESLVQAALDTQHFADAQVYLYALADLEGWTPDRYSQLRVSLEQTDQASQAAGLLETTLLDEDDPAALLRLAQYQIIHVDWMSAQATLEQLLALDSDNAQACYFLGVLTAPYDSATASSYLTCALHSPSLTPRAEAILATMNNSTGLPRADARTKLGLTLVSLGEWALAEHTFQASLEANMVNPTALAYLGFVRDQQGRDGLFELQAAIDMTPNDPVLYYLLGQHWRGVGDYDLSYNAFLLAYNLDTENPALAVEVGLASQLLLDLSGAEEWLRLAIELEPTNPDWYRVLAVFYADSGYQADTVGLDFVQEASELVPDDPDILASLGWVYHLIGDHNQAYEKLEAAAAVNPQSARTQYYLGIVLELRGDKNSAVDAYWIAVNLAGTETGFGLLAARALQRLGFVP